MSFMTYEEIGDELGITKQAVSQNIKKGINKVYNNIVNNLTDGDYFEALMIMVSLFNIDNNDDFNQMYKLINKESKENIESSYEWTREKII